MGNKKLPENESAKLIKILSGLGIAGIFMIFIGAATKKWLLVIAGIAVMLSGGAVSSGYSAKRSKEFEESTEAAVKSGMGERTDMDDPIIRRILQNPYVLKDERISRLTEVQNLLQYIEIQRVFFDPGTLNDLSPHPRVRELLRIVRDWIAENDPEEIFAAANMLRMTAQPEKTVRSGSPKKRNAVFYILFFALWLVVFAVMFFAPNG